MSERSSRLAFSLLPTRFLFLRFIHILMLSFWCLASYFYITPISSLIILLSCCIFVLLSLLTFMRSGCFQPYYFCLAQLPTSFSPKMICFPAQPRHFCHIWFQGGWLFPGPEVCIPKLPSTYIPPLLLQKPQLSPKVGIWTF